MDNFYVAYFVIHIATTVAVDSAIGLPEKWTFQFQQKMLSLHVAANNDVLIINKPAWLTAFIWVEILLQLPFFFWAAYDLKKGYKRVWPAIIAYGVEASTTTLACLSEVFVDPTLDSSNKIRLILLYVPYLVIPLTMAIDFSRRTVKILTTTSKTKSE